MRFKQTSKYAIDMRMNLHDIAARMTFATAPVSYALRHQSRHALTKVSIPARMSPMPRTITYEAREHASLAANAYLSRATIMHMVREV